MIRALDLSRVAPMFEGRHDTLIRACLSGNLGGVWTDDPASPAFAVMVAADFTFFAGIPDHRAFSEFPWDATKGYTLFTPPDSAWDALVNTWYGDKARPRTRYAIRHEPDAFDDARLAAYAAACPAPYVLRKFDEDLWCQSLREDWSASFCENFRDWDDYAARGIGWGVVLDGRLVAGASAYAVYPGGVELEVDTHEAHRRRGLARASCAAAILDCRARGLYASWDAANRESVALAESLGYHEMGSYTVYAIQAPAENGSKTR
ncbi:MAG: GNAT family N-acetyltransferase [Clostridiaceae bacterium]|nr:GNAT family N-acetyltransferase [Clostridiaceae bacterium]